MAVTAERPFSTSPPGSGDDWSQPSTQVGTGMESGSMSTGSTGQGSGTGGSGDMLGRVIEGAHQTLDRLAETAAPHVQRLQDGVGVRAEQVKAMSDEWAETLRTTVRDNPLAAVATAMALGVLIARLTQR